MEKAPWSYRFRGVLYEEDYDPKSINSISMDSDYGIPRELSDLQKIRSLYHPELPPCLQGTTVRVEFGNATTVADSADAPSISRLFPNTYGHPLAHFLRANAKVPNAQIIT
ncbi:unnamed protein product [Lupinus luteus]|uniref:Uncharacterized protein n=1 Tax=Lupinus luteus TaxID=3873 RepID=A0AAV1Y4B0_LUPLU